MKPLYEIGRPIIVAHRGGASEHPENSPEAFAAMREQGFRFIETDARVTRDGIAVLSHDPTLDRTTDASGPLSSYTWRELSRLRSAAGGPAIMRVDDALGAFPDLFFNIDAKHDAVAAPLADAIRRTGSEKRVCIASFSEKRLRGLRRALPHVTSSMGVAAIARVVAAARMPGGMLARRIAGPERGVHVAQVPVRTRGIPVVDEAFVSMCHSRGIAVQVWTINDVDEAERLLDLGVDGIITDVPAQMREALPGRFFEE